KWDDPILARVLAVLPLHTPHCDALFPGYRVEIAERAVGAQHAFSERYRTLGAAQEPSAKPAFQATRVTDHRGKRHYLGLNTLAAAHANERQDEFKVCAARSVGDHLHLVDNDDTRLRKQMRMCQRQGRKFLIGEQRDIVAPAN